MWKTFSNPKNQLGDKSNDFTSPYNSSLTWMLESFFIDIYSLLVHRIKGLGLSLFEFMKWDTWTTSKLYCMELELIAKEEKELNKDKEEVHDDEEVVDLMEEMYG